MSPTQLQDNRISAERAARAGSVFGGSDQGAVSTGSPPPWPGQGTSPLGPTSDAETQHGAAADPTVPPLPEEEGEGEAEREDPSTEPLRKVAAGRREPEISRVKPAPTGSRGLPPAKAWQDWFTIRLRTWANVNSPAFEAELVKKV